MATVTTITPKGQVTIPAFIRKVLDLKPFDKLVFSIQFGKVVGEPVKTNIMDLYGSVKPKTKKIVDLKELRKSVLKKYTAKIAAEGR